MGFKRLKVISSVLLYVLLALPVWWHVTSIHRPPIPFDRIQQAVEDVSIKSTHLPVELIVYHVHPRSNEGPITHDVPLLSGATYVVEQVNSGCGTAACLNLTHGVLDAVVSNQQLDGVLHKQLQKAGLSRANLYVLFIVPIPALLAVEEASRTVVVGQYRHAWILQHESDQPADLVQKIKAATPALEKLLGYQKGSTKVTELPISAASQTVLSFSLCNADPTSGFFTWSFADMRQRYLQPVVDILAPVVQLFIHSQVLYHTPTPAAVTWSEEHKAYVVKEKELPFFVDSNWNLESGRSVIGTTAGTTESSMSDIAAATTPPSVLHWVVFIPPPSQRPLKIRLRGGSLSPSNSFWIPSWGGVIIINPEETAQKVTGGSDDITGGAISNPLHRQLDAADLHHIAGVVVSHLHSLLGIPAPRARSDPVRPDEDAAKPLFLSPVHTGFTLWEVEQLVRKTVQQRVVGAAHTLQSLARLVQELPNLEMPDLIGDQVWHTLEAINNTLQSVERGSYLEASANATQARGSAEVAFSHPAVLAQLNFPESHKLGIYMPYFLPVAVPLFQALVGELRRLIVSGKKRTASA